MKYIEQSYKNLHLTLTKSIDLNSFSILESETIELTELTIKLYIIGESHIIHYLNKENSFYEVFACKTLENDDVILSKSIDKIRQNSIKIDKKNYSFNLDILDKERVDSNLYNNYIEFVFPKNSKTSIGVNIVNNYIKIETLHSYLNENKYIYTTQKLKYKD